MTERDRFIDNGDGTITDTQTGLVWEKGEGPRLTWQEAVDRCKALDLAGHCDWRLPTIQELFAVVDFGRYAPACDPVFGMRSYSYWSATTDAGGSSYAWGLYFGDGGAFSYSKSGNYYVRAVRGGLDR